MATMEKLLVQIFDRKRQIIEKLKYQKQLYDQHLLSKLLIQGIPPPSWLLSSDSQISTSDLTALNKEEIISGLMLPRPGTFASYPTGHCFLYDEPVITAANSGIPDETCAGKCASSNGFDEDGPGVAPMCRVDGIEDTDGIVPPCRVDGTEDAADIASLSHVDDSVDTFNYAPMSPDEQTDTRFSNAYKPEQSLVKIQRSRSRQKALEFRNSAKTSAKSRLGTENSNICRDDEQLGLRRSLELAEPSALSTGVCSNKEVAVGNCSNKELSADAYGGSLAQSTGFGPEICSKEEVATGYRSDKEKNVDASGGPFTHSTVNEANEVEMADNQKIEEYSNVHGGRITRSRSSCQQSVEGAHPLNKKSMDVCVGQITRSKSGLTQQTETSIGNNIKAYSGKFTRSKSGAEEAETRFQRSMSKEVSVKPKQLDFDEVEESNLGVSSHLSGSISLDTLEERTKTHTIENSSSLPCAISTGTYPQSLAYKTLEVPGSENAHALYKSDKISRRTLILQDCEGGLQSSLDAEATEVAQISPGRIPVGLLVPVTDFAPTVTRDTGDEAEADSAQPVEMVKLGSLSKSSALQASSSSHGKQVGDSELFELGAEVTMLHNFNYNNAIDGSWPCYKRRKIGYQNPNKSSSPTLRVNSCRAISENIPNRSSWGEKENIPNRSSWGEKENTPNRSSWGEKENISSRSSWGEKENIPNRSSWSEKENIHPVSQKSTHSHNSGAALSEYTILAKKTDQSFPSSPSREHVLTPQVECGKDKISLGRIALASTYEHLNVSESDVLNVNRSITAEPSDFLPEDGEVKTNALSAASCSEIVSGGLVYAQDLGDGDAAVKLMDTKMAVDQRKSHQRVHDFKLSIGSPLMEFMNIAETDQTIPELERFVIGENTVDAQSSGNELFHEEAPFLYNKVDRTSLPEVFCKSATLSTPVSPFPMGCKLYLAPGIYSSVPNGLLENIDIQSNLLPSGSALFGKSHSDLFSFPGCQYGWDIKKPFLSPVGMGYDGVASKSGGSDKLGNSNLELTCFPILEDPESGEEDVNDDVNSGVKKTSSTMKNSADREPPFDITAEFASSLVPDHVDERGSLESSSVDVKRTDSSTRSGSDKESLCDIAVQNETTLAPDLVDERYSVGSVCTEISTREMRNDSKNSMGQWRSRQTRLGKENKGFSVGASSSKKHSKPLSSRFSKPKLSEKSLKSRGQSLSEKGQKRNNIVSNIKSFVQLVQQKQAAAVLPEKRDVKVKALQAAEAAKRAAEIRENDRKQKKEAMKLERARVEQENMKKMELKRKLKEEQRKKREAENAAKKRQREEEEKKEKERKKQRVEEARLQHKQAEEKLLAWKEELRCAAEEERAQQRKDLNEKIEKQPDEGYERADSEKLMNAMVVDGSDRREADDGHSTLIDHNMSTGCSATGKVGDVDVAESSTPNIVKNDKPNHRTSSSQSYGISPYQCSDDEEELMDEIPNKKFVPTWASKSCVISALSSLQHVDPDVIFPPGSFCSMEEEDYYKNKRSPYVYMRTELAEDLLLVCEQIYEGQHTLLSQLVSWKKTSCSHKCIR